MRQIAAIGLIFKAAHSLVYIDFFLLLTNTSSNYPEEKGKSWLHDLSFRVPRSVSTPYFS